MITKQIKSLSDDIETNVEWLQHVVDEELRESILATYTVARAILIVAEILNKKEEEIT